MVARETAKVGTVKAATHWTRKHMRVVALFWRLEPCAANLQTAIWWRDFPYTYGETTQIMGSGDTSADGRNPRRILRELREQRKARIRLHKPVWGPSSSDDGTSEN